MKKLFILFSLIIGFFFGSTMGMITNQNNFIQTNNQIQQDDIDAVNSFINKITKYSEYEEGVSIKFKPYQFTQGPLITQGPLRDKGGISNNILTNMHYEAQSSVEERTNYVRLLLLAWVNHAKCLGLNINNITSKFNTLAYNNEHNIKAERIKSVVTEMLNLNNSIENNTFNNVTIILYDILLGIAQAHNETITYNPPKKLSSSLFLKSNRQNPEQSFTEIIQEFLTTISGTSLIIEIPFLGKTEITIENNTVNAPKFNSSDKNEIDGKNNNEDKIGNLEQNKDWVEEIFSDEEESSDNESTFPENKNEKTLVPENHFNPKIIKELLTLSQQSRISTNQPVNTTPKNKWYQNKKLWLGGTIIALIIGRYIYNKYWKTN